MNRRELWGLLSKIVTNATNRTCQHPPSWIFQMLRCILWSETSLLLTTHIAGGKPFHLALLYNAFFKLSFSLIAPNLLALATTLKNLGARWLLAKKVNFVPCVSCLVFLYYVTDQLKRAHCQLNAGLRDWRKVFKISNFSLTLTVKQKAYPMLLWFPSLCLVSRL